MSEQKMDGGLSLDRIAAQRGQQIVSNAYDGTNAKEIENLVTKVLGVFQENGVYAGFLFLLSRDDRVISKQLLSFAREDLAFDQGHPKSINDVKGVLGYVSDAICDDLDRLLLAKQVFEQTLIYARYGAKALGAQKGEEDGLDRP